MRIVGINSLLLLGVNTTRDHIVVTLQRTRGTVLPDPVHRRLRLYRRSGRGHYRGIEAKMIAANIG